jgi:hypothetical protein
MSGWLNLKGEKQGSLSFNSEMVAINQLYMLMNEYVSQKEVIVWRGWLLFVDWFVRIARLS